MITKFKIFEEAQIKWYNKGSFDKPIDLEDDDIISEGDYVQCIDIDGIENDLELNKIYYVYKTSLPEGRHIYLLCKWGKILGFYFGRFKKVNKIDEQYKFKIFEEAQIKWYNKGKLDDPLECEDDVPNIILKGDYAKCVDNKGLEMSLKLNKIYYVHRSGLPDSHVIHVIDEKGFVGGFHSSRFEKVNKINEKYNDLDPYGEDDWEDDIGNETIKYLDVVRCIYNIGAMTYLTLNKDYVCKGLDSSNSMIYIINDLGTFTSYFIGRFKKVKN